jgi:hypothetical protein
VARSGALLAYIATSPEREEEAREEMLAELDRFTREPVEPGELAQAVSYLAGQAEVSRQNGSAVAGEILEAWLAGNGLGELADPGARFRAVTAADVQRWPPRRWRRTAAPRVVQSTGAARPPVAVLQGWRPPQTAPSRRAILRRPLRVGRRPGGHVHEAGPSPAVAWSAMWPSRQGADRDARRPWCTTGGPARHPGRRLPPPPWPRGRRIGEPVRDGSQLTAE